MMNIKYALALALIIIGIILNLKLQDAMAEGEDIDWELQQLHDPTPARLTRLQRGRVTKHDGLPAEEFERALDEQAEPLGHRM